MEKSDSLRGRREAQASQQGGGIGARGAMC